VKFHYKVICLIIGSLTTYFLISYDTANKDALLPYNAPKIKSIFENNKKDPHLNYVSKDGCLLCHLEGAKLSKDLKAPLINHEILNDCNLCHIIN